MSKQKKKIEPVGALATLLAEPGYLTIPKAGDVVKGKIVSVTKNLVKVDIEGYRTGVVRGPELADASHEHESLKLGDEVEATVIDLENESGDVELSFRFAGTLRAWEKLRELMAQATVMPVKIIDANKGGLIGKVQNIAGFMPVSQLAPENYPRVTGGDKQKIFEKLRSFVGTTMQVKVIDINEPEEKLIISEKAVWEDEQRGVLAACTVGDTVEGEVTAIADFGAFVRFRPVSAENAAAIGALEGLVHISEIAWQRIDHPRDLLKVGDTVKAQIIGIEGSRIFLSMKSLVTDPWKNVSDTYHVGQIVRGIILKENPFGFFVELDPEIHGLAHISEISERVVKTLGEVAKPGDTLEWKIITIEPEQHRLGLSRKGLPKTAREIELEASAPSAGPEEATPEALP